LTVHRYTDPSSIIEKVTFVKGDDDGIRAYLQAREGTSHEQLAKISVDFNTAGYKNTATEYDGKSALEARGFLWKGKCTDLLIDKKLVAGEPVITESPEDKISFVGKVKKNSLFSSGLLYLLGDVNFIRYGIKGKSPLNIAGGAFYMAGTMLNLVFNRKSNADIKTHDIAQMMADHMNGLNIPLPEDAAISRIIDDKNKGIIKTVDDWARRYPAELMHAGFAMAGACIAIAAFKNYNHSTVSAGQLENYMALQVKNKVQFPKSEAAATAYLAKMHKVTNGLDIGLGTMTIASGLFAALVPEKAHDPDAPKKSGVASWWEWMQEHPLSIAGTGLMMSTMCHAVSTGIEYRIGNPDARSAIFSRGVFVATNLLAEFLIAISSKGHGAGVKNDPSIDNTAISMAAELIARHPSDKQPELVTYMSKFLGRPDVLAIDDHKAEELLKHAVEVMKKNPWALATTAPAVPERKVELASKNLPVWQAKVEAGAPYAGASI